MCKDKIMDLRQWAIFFVTGEEGEEGRGERREKREENRKKKCSTSFPGGDQVDGLPPASSLITFRWLELVLRCCKVVLIIN